MNLSADRIYDGMKNPILVLLLCPAVAACTDAMSGLWMGIASVLAYAAAECVCYALRTVLPGKARLPVLVASAGTVAAVLSLLFEAYLPGIYSVIGAYLPLIAVFCLILDLAETGGGSAAPSLSGKIGLALGFTAFLIVFGLLREFLGAGTLFGLSVLGELEAPGMFVRAPGAFLTLALILMGVNALRGNDGNGKEDAP